MRRALHCSTAGRPDVEASDGFPELSGCAVAEEDELLEEACISDSEGRASED